VYLLEFTVLEKVISLIIFIVLTAHHTPTLMSCNSTLCNTLRLFANQYLFFWVFIWLCKYNHTYYFRKPVTKLYSHN